MEIHELHTSIKEIESLTKQSNVFEKKKIDQNLRVKKVKELKLNKEEELSIDKERLISETNILQELEQELDSEQNKLEQLKRNLHGIKTSQEEAAYENQEISLKEKIRNLENDAFSRMESVEELTEKISQYDNFFQAIHKSIIEITEDATINIQKIELDLKNCLKRILFLKEALTSENLKKLEYTLSLNLPRTSLSVLRDAKCFICQSTISNTLKEKIERNSILYSCPMCKRIMTLSL